MSYKNWQDQGGREEEALDGDSFRNPPARPRKRPASLEFEPLCAGRPRPRRRRPIGASRSLRRQRSTETQVPERLPTPAKTSPNGSPIGRVQHLLDFSVRALASSQAG